MKYAAMVFLIPAFLASGFGQAPWPTFQYDNQRTGRCPYPSPAQPETLWTFLTSGEVWSSPVVAEDGTIYFGSMDGSLYGLHSDGSLKWSYATKGDIYSSPALDNEGRIYIGSKDSCVYCIEDSVTSARVKWTFPTNGRVNSCILVADGVVYARTGHLYAIDSTGNQKWTYHTHLSSPGGPASSPDRSTVYIETCDPAPFEYAVAALDTNGTRKWLCDIGSAPFDFSLSTPTVSPDGAIFFPTFSAKTFYAIAPGGTVKWGCNLGDESQLGSAALNQGDTAYIGCLNGNLHAVAPDGTIDWTFATGAAVQKSPIVDSSGTILIGSGFKFYALNPDGTLKWEYELADRILSSPALTPDGTLLFGAGNKLYALGQQTGISSGRSRRLPVSLAVFPNPFSTSACIRFTLDKPGPVSLAVYNSAGRLVRTLANGRMMSGTCRINWDGIDEQGRKVGNGVYLCKLRTGSGETVKTVTVLR